MKKIKRLIVHLLIVSLVFIFIPQNLNAASLTSMSDTMSRIKASTASNHTIKYTTPTGVAAGQTMTVTFPTGFTMGSVAFGDVDVSWGPTTGAENELTLAATASGTTWGAAVTGQVLTITSGTGTITAASKVIIEIGTNATFGVAGVNQITNQTVVQNNTDPKIVIGGTFGDTGSIATEIVADDQIPVSATVDPTITFTIVNTTLALGTLSSSSISTSSYNNLTIGTNGFGGYTISVRDIGSSSNPGLYNSPAAKLIASADATPLTVGNEGYGGQCNKVSGDGSCSFTGTGDNVDGFLLTDQALASYGSKPSGTDTFQIRVKATISTSTDAGSYADTLTLIATGNF